MYQGWYPTHPHFCKQCGKEMDNAVYDLCTTCNDFDEWKAEMEAENDDYRDWLRTREDAKS